MAMRRLQTLVDISTLTNICHNASS